MKLDPQRNAGLQVEPSMTFIDTDQGPMRAIVAWPTGLGPFPAVVTYPHVGGLTDTMQIMAERVAAGGYVCIVPDLYHRLGTIVIDPQSDDPDVVAIRSIAAASVTAQGVLEDTAAVFRWLDQHPQVRGPVCATLGFGRGGSLALRAAGAFPERVRTAASVLGFGFMGEGREAASACLARIAGGVYCAFAEHDHIIPASERAELASILDTLALDSTLVVHPGVHHPYIFPDRLVYDEAAASRDWDAIFAMFARHLGDGSKQGSR